MVAAKTRRAEPTEHAQAAKQIRAALKTAYPRIKFSVRSESFSMGNAVDISWIDGPTTRAVDALVSQHEQGHFDGMRDLYEYDNVRADIPQAKYVQTHRGSSPAAFAAIVDYLNQRFGYHLRVNDREPRSIDHTTDQHIGCGWASHEIHRTFHKLSLVCPACGSPTLPGDHFCPDCGASLPAEDR